MRATLVSAVVGTWLLPGCSDAASGPSNPATSAASASKAPWQSGTRLKARIADGGHGAKLFVGWHDALLDFDCAFHRAQDGKLRCIPEVQAAAPLYSDFRCKDAVVAYGDSYVPPALMRVAGGDLRCLDEPWSPDRPDPVVRVGARVDGKRLFAPSGVNGSCDATGLSEPLAGYQATILAPSSFVAAREVTIEGEPVGARVILADDGSQETPALTDSSRNTACVLASGYDPALAFCLPNPVFSPTTEDACSELASDEASAHSQEALGCPDAPRPQVMFEGISLQLSCDAPSAVVLHASPQGCGEQFDTSALPQLSLRTQGTGRLRVRFAAASNGHVAHNPLRPFDNFDGEIFLDSDRGATCTPTATREGRRCLPEFDESSNRFLDASCTQPAEMVDASCDGVPNLVVATLGPVPAGGGQRPVETLYESGQPFDTTAIYEDTGAACTPSPAAGNLVLPLYELDLTSFAPVSERLE